jgi:hypothetical protein
LRTPRLSGIRTQNISGDRNWLKIQLPHIRSRPRRPLLVNLLYYIVSHISTIMTFDWLVEGSSWPWSYGNWIYNYLCNHCLSPLMLRARISIKARCTTLCDKVCQWLAKGHWFSPGPPVSSINKTDRHDITEILLKVVLNTIKQTDWLVDWISRISFAVIQVHNDVCFVSRLYIEVGKQYSPT